MSLSEATHRTLGYQDKIRDEDTKVADATFRKLLDGLPSIEAPEGFKKLEIELYACPTPDCGNYFGVAGMADLAGRVIGTKSLNYEPKPESEHRTGATCPYCFIAGKRVERVRVSTFAFVPLG